MCEGFGLRDAGRVEGMRVGFTRKRERFVIDVANCTEAALEQVAMQARAVRCAAVVGVADAEHVLVVVLAP